MPEPTELVTIPVFGNGAYYSPRFDIADGYPAISNVPIIRASIVFRADELLDADDVLAMHPPAIQRFALSYAAELRSVLQENGRLRQREMRKGVELPGIATGDDLVHALHLRIQGERQENVSTRRLRGDGIAPTHDVDLALQRGGIRLVRFTCLLDDTNDQCGAVYYIVDRTVLRRPSASLSNR